ncbi:MAG: hypothetical protein KCHDKBKB_03130 [Elusimicrobia bacterium]|nr:hypothetical protein [Elusimicrobiota bacterium]
MRKNIKLFLSCATLMVLIGCHQMDVKEVTSRLRVGMNKEEMQTALEGEKFLKEQIVNVYPGSTEQQTRGSVWNNQHYDFVYPENLILEKLPFDGSVKILSYLIKEEKRFAVPVSIDHLAIFYDQNKNQVIGWAHLTTAGEVRTWDELF